MDKNASLEVIADVSSGVAIDRRGAGARVVMVGDLEAKGLVSHNLKPAGAPSSGVAAKLREFDILISLRGKVNNAAVYANAGNGDEPTFASLDLGVLRLRKPSEVKAMALAIWLNLPSTQKSLSGSRRGSVMLRLPLPALRRLEVPILSDRFEKLLVEAWADAKQAERVEMEIRDLRSKMINEMFRRAVERASDLTEDGAIK